MGDDGNSLAQATKRHPDERSASPIEGAIDPLKEATDNAERAAGFFKMVAEGRLDPMQLSGEVEPLLKLLERLDRDGDWEEALDLARAAAGVFALAKRWVALLRSLAIARRAADNVGDELAVAWAEHELGTLYLAAENAGGADGALQKAFEIRQRLGDRPGLAATDHNLRVLCQQLRELLRERGPHPRRRVLVAAAVAILVFGGGVAAGALVDGGEGGDSTIGGDAGPNDETVTNGGSNTEPTTEPAPGAPPAITIEAPSEGASFAADDKVEASYTCRAAENAELASCDGPVPIGSVIDMSPGSHEFTVKAADEAGLEAQQTVNYTVSQPEPTDTAPPDIEVTSPGESTTEGAQVAADYKCTDEPGGSGVASCTGSVADEELIDTSSAGDKSFTVTAVDNAGNEVTETVTYSVLPFE